MQQKFFGVLLIVVGLGLVVFFNRQGFFERVSDGSFFPSRPTTTESEVNPTDFGFGGGEENNVPPQYEEPYSEPYVPPASTPPPPTSAPEEPISQIHPYDIPEGFSLKDLSPHFHKVRLSWVSPGDVTYNTMGQISLAAWFEGSQAINVSGWLLKANRGSHYVPRAVNVYAAAGTAAESDILLKSGDTLNIYFGTSSPLGVNLRLNLCTGYLANRNAFYPDMPRSCPSADSNELRTFTGVCQDYVSSLWSCTEPDPNPPVPVNDYACLEYLKSFTYSGCVQKYSSRADFLSNEWRAWAGGLFLDSRHDTLELRDRQGLLVDIVTY